MRASAWYSVAFVAVALLHLASPSAVTGQEAPQAPGCDDECPPPPPPPPTNTPPVVTIVTPATAVGTRTPVVKATYTIGEDEPGDKIDSTSIVLTWGLTNVTSLSRLNSRLLEWEVSDAHKIAAGGSKGLSVKVCNVAGQCTTVSRTVALAGGNKPVLSVTPMPLEATGRQFNAPFGRYYAIRGADVEMGVGTPAYRSLNAERTAGLTYSSKQSYPRALVNVDLESPGALPTSLTMKLWDGGVVVHEFTPVVALLQLRRPAALPCHAAG